METIKNYLENIFSNLPQSNDILKAKEELLCMMEDKYNELKLDEKTENEAIGIVISEFGNIDEIIDNLDASPYEERDYLIENETIYKTKESKFISLDMAKDFISDSSEIYKRISLGVMLCISSPIVALLLWGFSKNNILPIDINVSYAIGAIVLLGMVIWAVGLFINSGLKLEKYEYLKENILNLDQDAKDFVKNEDEAFNPIYAKKMAIGVGLCIISVIPLVLSALTLGNDLSKLAPSIALLLLIVAFAVRIFVIDGTKYESYKILLQEGEYSIKTKENQLVKAIASVYWPAIVLIYLVWSFTTKNYTISWILWPAAGILFAIISNVCNIIEKKKENIY